MRSRFVALAALTAVLVVASAQADEDVDPFPAPSTMPDVPDVPELPELPPLKELPPLDGAPAPHPKPTPRAVPTPAPTSTPAPTPNLTRTSTVSSHPTAAAPAIVAVPADPAAALGQYDEYRRSIDAYSIDTSAVTTAEYERCVAAGKCKRPTCTTAPTSAVTCVDQTQAQTYCAFAGGRLPTEDEWEHAAREGTHLGIKGMRDGLTEWTSSPYCFFCGRDDQVVRGGPTRIPGLRGWRAPRTSEDDLGFRCAR